MNILSVLPYYVPEGGGLERYAHATARHLTESGHHVQAIAATKQEPGNMILDGVNVRTLSPSFRLGNAPIRLGLARMLRQQMKDERPDVVIGHGPVPFPAEAAAYAAAKEDIPFVLTYHAGRLRGGTPFLDVLAGAARISTQPRLFRRSDRLIAVSRFVRDTALADHRDRATVIAPGVDAVWFTPGRADPRTILFVGPLDTKHRWKGVDVLCSAFEMIRNAGTDARLHLVGSGNRLAEFQAWAAGRNDVSIDGHLDEDGLLAAYQGAGVVVLPSLHDAEAFGMVLPEANACGRPVIGSNVGGIPEFVQHGVNGMLINPGDARDLADAMTALLDDPRSMDDMGRRGRAIVQKDHAWPDIANRTEAVLETVIERT